MAMSEEARKQASERAKARWAKIKEEEMKSEVSEQAGEQAVETDQVPTEPTPGNHDVIGGEQSIEQLKRDFEELKALFASQNQQNQQKQAPQELSQVQVGARGMVGTFEKYTVDPANYDDPTARLAKEPRLAPFAFDYNYNLSFAVEVTQYETKDGINTKEPRFRIELSRKRYDEMGEPVTSRNMITGKDEQEAFLIGTFIFHEDPQAAIIVARENGLEIDETDQVRFLNEMRYLRARDWLMGIFFPAGLTQQTRQREEVIGGRLTQIITLSSENASSIPFNQLTKKL